MEFNKYKIRSASYHWQQISRSIFKLNAYVLARYQQVIKNIPENNHQKILDIGCGDGVLLHLVSRKIPAQLYGVDSSQISLHYAKTKVKAEFILAQAEKLPFENNFFDTVLATEIIEHLRRPELMLAEIKRVLKPKGRLILTTPTKLGLVPEDKQHVQEFTPVELNQLLKKYFASVTISASHPAWLKRLYLFSLFKFGRYSLEPFRLIINLLVLLININPFLLSFPAKTQLLAVCRL